MRTNQFLRQWIAVAALTLTAAPLAAQTSSPTVLEGITDKEAETGVDVSLGREEVKNAVAEELGLAPVEVPLSLHLPLELAKQVCEEEVFEARFNANRSCTATRYVPELAAAVREIGQTTSAVEQQPTQDGVR